MPKKSQKKVTVVREHPLRVPISKKNPTGITIRDRHLRRLKGTYLDLSEIEAIFKNYDQKGLIYPTQKKLARYKNADKYDEVIAVWTDYFNKIFNAVPPLEPDVVKALIASESGFRVDPSENKIAFGITQITKETLKILQDPDGEAKDFIFTKIRQKDLKNPNIAIPMGVRWLFRKRATATNRLKRPPNHEELILEYKGLLKSKTAYRNNALKKFREVYADLKKNSKFYLLTLFFLVGCATSSYRILSQENHSAELNVSPDRILLECEWLHDADIKGLYGFMIHVLDDENTVLTLIQGNTLNKEGCDRRIKKIGAILREGKNIYIAGMGDLNEPRIKGKRSYQFPKIGTFHSNERTLYFAAIANEHGTCYDAYSGDEKPCPREPFPKKEKVKPQ